MLEIVVASVATLLSVLMYGNYGISSNADSSGITHVHIQVNIRNKLC